MGSTSNSSVGSCDESKRQQYLEPLTERSNLLSFSIENNFEAGRHIRASIIYEDDEGFSPLVKTPTVFVPYTVEPGETCQV